MNTLSDTAYNITILFCRFQTIIIHRYTIIKFAIIPQCLYHIPLVRNMPAKIEYLDLSFHYFRELKTENYSLFTTSTGF